MSNGKDNGNSNIYLHIPSITIMRITLALVLAIGLFVLRDIIILLLFAIVIAAAIDPLATRFEARGVPRIIALLLVYLGIILGIVSFFWVIVPPLVTELSDFTENFSYYSRSIFYSLARYGIGSGVGAFGGLEAYFDELSAQLAKFIPNLPSLFAGAVGRGTEIITVFLASFYLALQRDGEEKFLRMLAPDNEEPYIVDLWKRAQKKIGQWLQGQIVLAVLIGVSTFLGLTLLGVHYALILAIIAGILEIVPIVGPIATAIIAISVAFFQDPAKALLVGIFFLLLQQLEGNVLVPIIFKKVLGLHPVIVIFSLLVGARLGGIPGMLLAVPVAAVLMELFSDFSHGKVKV